MQLLSYSANPCQHHHLPASFTVSAQFGKLALIAVTPSIPQNNQLSRDPFPYFIQIHKPIARTLQNRTAGQQHNYPGQGLLEYTPCRRMKDEKASKGLRSEEQAI